MIRKYIRIVVSLFLLYSCNNTNNTNNTSINYLSTVSIKKTAPISFDVGITDSNLIAVFDSTTIIELKAPEEYLIGKISDVFIHNNKLIIVDKFKGKSIFVFNLNGEFLYKIGNIGKGPGEYTSINSVGVFQDFITVLDRISWKFIIYNTEGDFIKEKRFEVCPSEVFMLNQETYIVYYTDQSSSNYTVTIVDSTFKEKEKLFPFQGKRGLMGGKSPFQKMSDTSFIFTPLLCDTIFLITPKEIIPRYHFKINDNAEIADFKEDNQQLPDRDFYKKLFDNDIGRIISFFEINNNLYLQYAKGGCAYILVISKKTNIPLKIKLGCLSDISELIPLEAFNSFDKYIISSIDQYSFSELPEEFKKFLSQTTSAEDMKKIKEHDINDNPLICLFKLKSEKNEE